MARPENNALRIDSLFVRHFRSFNVDYLARDNRLTSELPWNSADTSPSGPFVEIPLEETITTIVGANEAGKSQALSAIEFLLSSPKAERADYCRYAAGLDPTKKLPLPEFGCSLRLGESRAAIKATLGVADGSKLNQLAYFIHGSDEPTGYAKLNSDWEKLSAAQTKALSSLLPKPFRLEANVGLPDRVPLSMLAGEKSADSPLNSTQRLQTFAAALLKLESSGQLTDVLATKEAFAQLTAPLESAQNETGTAPTPRILAMRLLIDVAAVPRSTYQELLDAVRNGDDGVVNDLIVRVNEALESGLTMEKWWSQDPSFRLRVSPRGTDLCLLITDRTGRDYSFRERSNGLRYFLSYLVQYLSHQPSSTQEILLMDEPDAYLSGEGQQDLLRILSAFACPFGSEGPQAILVTHSPYLVDRNHAERVRVLQKGAHDEGTRVVATAAQNHYEPLRTALGGFVAETVFMSGCNVLLEGQSDQMYLATANDELRRQGTAPPSELLDLNHLTLVPCSGADNVPFVAYLARGRDHEKPAIVALLDSDGAGEMAAKTLKKGGAYKKRLVDEEHILRIAEFSPPKTSPTPRVHTITDIEDLLPVPLLEAACEHYLETFLGIDIGKLTITASHGQGLLEAAQSVIRSTHPDFCFSKVGLARSVTMVLRSNELEKSIRKEFRSNFAPLLSGLANAARSARRIRDIDSIGKRVQRDVQAFCKSNRDAPSQDDARLFLDDLIRLVSDDPSAEAQALEAAIRKVRAAHCSGTDRTTSVEDYETFTRALKGLAYETVKDTASSQGPPQPGAAPEDAVLEANLTLPDEDQPTTFKQTPEPGHLSPASAR